jgi:hypothetical protein
MSNYLICSIPPQQVAKTISVSAGTLSFYQTLLYDIRKYLIKQAKGG